MRSFNTEVLLSLILLSLAVCAYPGQFYVDASSGDDGNTGLTPQQAWKTITHALEVVRPTADEPVVLNIAKGTYSRGANGERLPLNLPSYITLKGHSRSDTIVDGEDRPGHPNEGQVIVCEDAKDVKITELTITGGNVYHGDRPIRSGGGICCINTSLTVQGCLLYGNGCAEVGGCIYVSGPRPVLICQCTIKRGSAEMGGGIGVVGGVAEVRDCTIEGGSALWGGSISASGSALHVVSCTMTEGHVYFGGGLALFGGRCKIDSCQIFSHQVSIAGGGIYVEGSELTVENSTMTRNVVYGFGGAVSAFDGASVNLFNCLLAENWAIDGGTLHGRASTFSIKSCTFAENSFSRAGALYLESGEFSALNSILWDCEDPFGSKPGSYQLKYCDVRGGYEGEGNFDLDPLFVAGPQGNYYLCCRAAGQNADSPCIDAGLGTALENGLDQFTTRTDLVPDQGLLDVGFHYPCSRAEQDLWVDAINGHDSNPGNSPDEPLKTICFALQTSLLSRARTVLIHVAPGCYSISTNGEKFPLQPKRPVHIIGAGPADTVIDASNSGASVFTLTGGWDTQIEGLTIRGGTAGISCYGSAPVIRDCLITHNSGGQSFQEHGGLYISVHTPDAQPLLQDCVIADNGRERGGAIELLAGHLVLSRCVIKDHWCWGSPIHIMSHSVLVMHDCIVYGNRSEGQGGAISGAFNAKLSNCLFFDNSAIDGGAIASDVPSSLEIDRCTFVGNSAVRAGGAIWGQFSTGSADNSIFWGNGGDFHITRGEFEVRYCCVESGYPGEGNISEDPLFTTGPLGSYYLCCRAAGQSADSPCIDAGSGFSSELGADLLTTRTDEALDTGVVDIGFHYPIPGFWVKCLLSGELYSQGDKVLAGLAMQNNEAEQLVNAYVGFVFPDGTLMCYDGQRWRFGLSPWFEGILVPSGFAQRPQILFVLPVPSNAPSGAYLFSALIVRAKTLSPIASCETPFQIR